LNGITPPNYHRCDPIAFPVVAKAEVC
jgi:hypothetical protein